MKLSLSKSLTPKCPDLVSTRIVDEDAVSKTLFHHNCFLLVNCHIPGVFNADISLNRDAKFKYLAIILKDINLYFIKANHHKSKLTALPDSYAVTGVGSISYHIWLKLGMFNNCSQ